MNGIKKEHKGSKARQAVYPEVKRKYKHPLFIGTSDIMAGDYQYVTFDLSL
jgi:hypothetical protein